METLNRSLEQIETSQILLSNFSRSVIHTIKDQVPKKLKVEHVKKTL